MLWFMSPNCNLDLEDSNPSFFLIIVYHHTTLGFFLKEKKGFSDSENIQTKIN